MGAGSRMRIFLPKQQTLTYRGSHPLRPPTSVTFNKMIDISPPKCWAFIEAFSQRDSSGGLSISKSPSGACGCKAPPLGAFINLSVGKYVVHRLCAETPFDLLRFVIALTFLVGTALSHLPGYLSEIIRFCPPAA